MNGGLMMFIARPFNEACDEGYEEEDEPPDYKI